MREVKDESIVRDSVEVDDKREPHSIIALDDVSHQATPSDYDCSVRETFPPSNEIFAD